MPLDTCKVCTRCGESDPAEHYASRSARWCKACYRAWYVERAGGMVQKSCECCGAAFECTARSARRRVYCSRQCKEDAKNAATKAALVASKPARSCLHCGGAIGPERRADAAYCSEQCNSAAHHATRKASWKVGERQERVSRAYIVARDQGTCHLCGKRCRTEEIHLDHLVPLSRGGDHSAANLRVACAACNLSKRAEARGEQLLLIG